MALTLGPYDVISLGKASTCQARSRLSTDRCDVPGLIRRSRATSLATLLLVVFLSGCSGGGASESSVSGSPTEASFNATNALAEVLTFHASFDDGIDADWALGDRQIYTARSYDEQDQAVSGIGNPSVAVADGAGRFGRALRFTARNQHAIFYKADRNVGYSSDDWSGTVSFWLSLDPAIDLEPGFCDPIQITDAAYNDAAIWVDFTAENPRQFRLGVFGDLDAWNPDGLSPDEHPGFLDRLVIVDEPPFEAGQWTHVVITYSGLNTQMGGVATLYLDGVPLPNAADGIHEPFTWDPARGAIRLGVNYVGLFDELSLFSRALTAEEVRALHVLEGGVAALHP